MEKSRYPLEQPSETPLELDRNLQPGEILRIGDTEYSIERVEDGAKLAATFSLVINRHVPVYYLDGYSSFGAQGGYHPEADLVVIFKNMTDETTLEHELVHAVEYHTEPTEGLLALYEKAKQKITEESFAESGFFDFNFMKNIHEFLASGRTSLAPILKKEGLYEDFVRETAYIFDGQNSKTDSPEN